MSRTWSITALAFSLVLAFALDALAQTRTETLRWTHDDPDAVTGFRVYYGLASRDSSPYTDSEDAGMPALVEGVFEYQLQVDAEADVYFAMTAYNDESESFYSNEKCRGPAGECAPPPPAADPAKAAVAGFALWDAASDTVIDSSFQSGEQISLADHGTCVAIEIKANAYLDSAGPGSVMYAFDGQEPSSCNVPGRSHENNSPFVWEDDTGPGKFECAATLTELGAHTLKVTPFDGDSCTGTQGTAVTLSFEVVQEAGSEPPTQGGIGKPGTPTLVQP